MGVSGADAGLAGISPSVMIAAVVAVAVCALIAAVAMILVQRRHRLRIDTLLGRLADYEHRSPEDGPTDAEPSPGEVTLDQIPEPDKEAVERLVGNDPLAGRTSHVRPLSWLTHCRTPAKQMKPST